MVQNVSFGIQLNIQIRQALDWNCNSHVLQHEGKDCVTQHAGQCLGLLHSRRKKNPVIKSTGGEAKGWLVRGKAPTDLEEATAAAEVRVEEVHVLAGGLREGARGVERLGAAGSRQQPGKSGGIRDQTRVGSNDKEG